MRIAYLANFTKSYRTEVWVAKSLKEIKGVDVIQLEERKYHSADLARKLKQIRPDVFLYSKANIAGDFGETMKWLKKNDIFSVCWLYDLFIDYPREPQLRFNPIFKGDLIVTTDGGHNKEFEEYGINHHCIRQGIFQEEAKLGKPKKEFAEPDIVFVGVGNKEWAYRRQLMDFLSKQYGKKFKWYGRERQIRGMELNNLFASTKIVIGDTVMSPGYWSNRIYETLGRGGFLIHPRIKGLEDEFEYYKHFVPYDFRNFSQLKQIIDYYLNADKEREKIKLAGHKFCKENYSYLARCKDLLKLIKNEQKRKKKIPGEFDKSDRTRDLSSKPDREVCPEEKPGRERPETTIGQSSGSNKTEQEKERVFRGGLRGVTAILLNYQRPENYPKLIANLKEQKGVDMDIWIWDSGDNLPELEDVKIFKDPVNPGVFIRWELARLAKTDYILFVDDDVLLKDDEVVIDTIKAQEKYDDKTIVGWKGVEVEGNYHKESNHYHAKHVSSKDKGVHTVKGNFMLFKREPLYELKPFPPEILEIDNRAHGEFWYEFQMGNCQPKHKVIKCLEGRLDNKQVRGKGLENRKGHFNKQTKHCQWCLDKLKCS